MFNTLLSFIFNILLTICSAIGLIITAPLYLLLSSIFPDFNLYFNTFNIFIHDYVLKGVSFVRECFFNLTGYPRPLFNAIIALLLFRITYHTSLLVFKFVKSIYYKIRGVPYENINFKSSSY